jgi:hypothetical protein
VGAGFIEGYVSPNASFTLPARIAIGVSYWLFMLALLSGRLWGARPPTATTALNTPQTA